MGIEEWWRISAAVAAVRGGLGGGGETPVCTVGRVIYC